MKRVAWEVDSCVRADGRFSPRHFLGTAAVPGSPLVDELLCVHQVRAVLGSEEPHGQRALCAAAAAEGREMSCSATTASFSHHKARSTTPSAQALCSGVAIAPAPHAAASGLSLSPLGPSAPEFSCLCSPASFRHYQRALSEHMIEKIFRVCRKTRLKIQRVFRFSAPSTRV